MKKFRKTIRNPETFSKKRQHDKNVLLYDFFLDLHGLLGDQAVSRLKAFLNNKTSCTIMICHGKGQGVLRDRVRTFLMNDPHVKKITRGESANLPEGDGVTIADL